MRRLDELDVSGNQLTGPLPPEWSNMTVKSLRLSNNQLNGSLPPEWRNMDWIVVMSLHDNSLVCPKTKLSGRKIWPYGPARTESMVPGSRSMRTARGT